ncbi:hypothetical protein [Thiorhodococcus fuscus]|uniref:PilZ domain-containing protein n=1 Tax=Thiorhodococcus fuscus TaxID=527200 RepID=A0ABW4YE49_9GAMM
MLLFRIAEDRIEVARGVDHVSTPEVLGFIPSSSRSIPDDLKDSCSNEEFLQLSDWLGELAIFELETNHLDYTSAFMQLPQMLADSDLWFSTTENKMAQFHALRIAFAMRDLEQVIEDISDRFTYDVLPAQVSPRGNLDRVTGEMVTGWAARPGSSDSLVIRFTINDEIEFKILADHPRPDVMEKGIHKNGRCGFRLKVPDLATGDRVRAFIEPDEIELLNSPAICGAN